MIDSSKKQQQGFPEILAAGDFEPLKEKECLEGNNQKSLKEGQSVDRGATAGFPLPSAGLSVCLLTVLCVCLLAPAPCTGQVL